MPTTSTPSLNAVSSPDVSISYYAAGRHQIVSFSTSSPDFHKTIQILREQNRPFRLIYR